MQEKRKYRQYDIKFKKKAVKLLQKARGKRKITAVAADLNVATSLLYRWESQVTSGIMSKRNSVSFSSNPSAMVRG